MSERQIEARGRDYLSVQRTRPRNLVSQLTTVTLQPVYFFRTLPRIDDTRQWLWAAILIIALSAFSTMRHAELVNGTSQPPVDAAPVDFGGPVPDGEFGGVPGGLPGGDLGGFPPGGLPTAPSTDGVDAGASTSESWTTVATVGAQYLLNWVILALLLIEASLLSGRAPRLGTNFQIAIWSSIPLALMAALQLIYFASGGRVGAPGISALLLEWPGFAERSPTEQALLFSAASVLTLFWLWSLYLIYFGARFALSGRRIPALLVVISWIAIVIVVPVVTGSVAVPDMRPAADEMSIDPLEFSFDPASASQDPEVTAEPALVNPDVMLTEEAPANGSGGTEDGLSKETEADAEERPESAPKGEVTP